MTHSLGVEIELMTGENGLRGMMVRPQIYSKLVELTGDKMHAHAAEILGSPRGHVIIM